LCCGSDSQERTKQKQLDLNEDFDVLKVASKKRAPDNERITIKKYSILKIICLFVDSYFSNFKLKIKFKIK
jgi:hypothetical protein